MLIVFKSKVAGDVIMFADVAMLLLDNMGKSRDKQGIFTVEQLPNAIKRLKQATAESRTHTAENDETKFEKTPAGGQRPFVSLAVRAVPLIELLERSLKANVPVVWGV